MKTEKLKITGYESLLDVQNSTTTGSIVVAANPDNVSLDFKSEESDNKDTGKYSGVATFKVLLDGTGALYKSDYTVAEQINYLKKLCLSYDAEKKSSAFIKVEWGTVFSGIGAGDATSVQKNYFTGKVSSLNFKYSHFSSQGVPLRADCEFSVKQVVNLGSSGGLTETFDFTKSVNEQDINSFKKSFKTKLKKAFKDAQSKKKASVRK